MIVANFTENAADKHFRIVNGWRSPAKSAGCQQIIRQDPDIGLFPRSERQADQEAAILLFSQTRMAIHGHGGQRAAGGPPSKEKVCLCLGSGIHELKSASIETHMNIAIGSDPFQSGAGTN